MFRRLSVALCVFAACSPQPDAVPDAGAALRSALSVCLGDAFGVVDTSKCTNLNASPPVIPTLDFGTADGTALRRTIIVVNTGPELLTVESGRFTDPGFIVATVPTTLPPSIPVTLNVGFDPTLATVRSSQFVLDTNDPTHSRLTIPAIVQPMRQLCLGASALTVTRPDGTEPGVTTATLTNCGDVTERITGLTFATGTPPSLTASFDDKTLPFELAPGATATLTIRYLGVYADVPVEATLRIVSEATFLDVPVTAESDVERPRLCVTPSEGLDFGSLPVGTERALTVTFANCGTVDFKLTKLLFIENDTTDFDYEVPAARLTGSMQSEIGLNAGDTWVVPVTFKPKKPDLTFSAFFSFESTFHRGTLAVTGTSPPAPPTCTGSEAPIARITATPGLRVSPLDTVTLSGAGSTAVHAGPLTYEWRLVSQPANGTVGFGPGSSVAKQLFAELSGQYEVTLVVIDAAQCRSVPAQATIVSRALGRLFAELTWPQAYGDVDLHLLGPNGTFFDSRGDCHWLNCKTIGSPPRPQLKWGGGANRLSDDGVAANDPILTVDALWGNGPEQIEIETPFDGTYTLVASYYCDTNEGRRPPDTTVTAQAHLVVDGSVALEATKSLVQSDIWEVAQVVVAGNTITVVPLSTPLRKTSGGMQSCR